MQRNIEHVAGTHGTYRRPMTTSTLPVDRQVLLPTDDDVAAYAEHGYWLSGAIVPDGVLDAAERGMERFYAGDHDAPFPGRTRYDDYDWQPGQEGLRKNDYAAQQVRELLALATLPIIGAVAARLAGDAPIRLWHDQLLYKPTEQPGAEANVGWHTDRQYWSTCTSTTMLTAWVPFHPCDAETGTITMIDGSHRWEDVGDLDFFDGRFEGADHAPAGQEAVQVPAVLRRGQVSFHHNRTIHGSGPNRSARPRRSMAIHLQVGENRWQDVAPAPGKEAYHRNDELAPRVDGVPDYADPRLFPQLWPPAS